MLECPVCGRRGSVHRSIPESGTPVVCSGGPPPAVLNVYVRGPYAMKYDPPHEPAHCFVVYGPDNKVARGKARFEAWKRRKGER